MQRTEQEYLARRNALTTLFYTYITGTLLKTANRIPEAWMNIRLGLIGEVGEVMDWVKKVRFHNKEADLTKIANELGDVLFYSMWDSLDSMHKAYAQVASPEYIVNWVIDSFANSWVSSELSTAEFFGPATDVQISELMRYATNGVQSGEAARQFILAASGYFGISIEQIVEANAAKLAKRHPNGWDGGRRYNEQGEN